MHKSDPLRSVGPFVWVRRSLRSKPNQYVGMDQLIAPDGGSLLAFRHFPTTLICLEVDEPRRRLQHLIDTNYMQDHVSSKLLVLQQEELGIRLIVWFFRDMNRSCL